MKNLVGLVGATGRMGKLLYEAINTNANYEVKYGFARSTSNQVSMVSLDELFQKNDFIVDFSHSSVIQSLVEAALKNPKPLIICTTGWKMEGELSQLIVELTSRAPVIIASNTSFGAAVQRYLVSVLAQILSSNFDIDLIEKHHRHKIDIPSGTGLSLINAINETKKEKYNFGFLKEGPRPDNFIQLAVQRSGNISGEHEITFTNNDEMISIKHIAFNRQVFASGVVKMLDWLINKRQNPGLYNMNDVLNIK